MTARRSRGRGFPSGRLGDDSEMSHALLVVLVGGQLVAGHLGIDVTLGEADDVHIGEGLAYHRTPKSDVTKDGHNPGEKIAAERALQFAVLDVVGDPRLPSPPTKAPRSSRATGTSPSPQDPLTRPDNPTRTAADGRQRFRYAGTPAASSAAGIPITKRPDRPTTPSPQHAARGHPPAGRPR